MTMENLYYYKGVEKKHVPPVVKKDLIIYGGTAAGITAAIQAKKMGLSVAIVEFGRHVGGMTAGGLGATDLGSEHAVGGLSKAFYEQVAQHYGQEKQWTFEPKVAQSIFHQWLEEHDIRVYFNQPLHQVIKKGRHITTIIMEDGSQYEGNVFIDATYEGDFLAMAGVSYQTGRESNETYGETYNGIQFGFPHHNFEKPVDPYVIPGDPSSGVLPGIEEEGHLGEQGEGDHRIQAYNFRICLTKDPDKKIPFPKPTDYDPKHFELLRRYINAGVWDAMNLHTMLPNGKTDLNNFGGVSTDYIGMNYDWPDGSYERREEIFQAHVNYNLGLLYFLANDPQIPKPIRDEVSEWGLPTDEFVETGHWPHQLYIREGRRMISDYVMTDRNCLQKDFVDDSIGIASYHMDSHHCRRVVIDGRCVNEGDVQIPIHPFAISYRSIRPKSDECTNLLVPVCLSSSHIAYGAIRMEPVFMILGQSAGAAAALAHLEQTTVQNIAYEKLKKVLLDSGQVIHWSKDIEDDPLKRMQQTFGKKSRQA